jgi:aspartyl-tRNA(Asn)/glutamyl-tRNA(Gln) amidotransferase subunit A
MSKPLNELSMHEAARMLRAKECSVRELWDACATAARERNPELNAYLELFDADDDAIAAAQERIDREGDAAPLPCGIPLAMKDNILIEGKVASAASKILENYVATYDATVTKKLKEAGALFVGRANMDEFAMGGSNEHSAFGRAKNPLDPERVPGGSSGGSAAAVAGGMAIAALGSDTGGSIRQPAAYCGLVGLKPTYGAVSRSGLIALGSSLDQIGPLARTVGDAKALFEAVRGRDPLDSTTIPDDLYPASESGETLRIGVPRDLLKEGLSVETRTRFEETLARLAADGHAIVDVSLPTSAHALPVYYVLMPAEASTNLARLDGMRYGLAKRGATLLDDYLESRTGGFGPEVRRRILLGTFVLSSGYIDAYYRKADAARALLASEYEAAFASVDVIAFPTTTGPAFVAGAKSDPVAMYLEDIFTVTANLTGMPAISVPMGLVADQGAALPVGMHFTAPKGREDLLFKAAAAVTEEEL